MPTDPFARIDSSFSAQSLMETFGAELVHVDNGSVHIRAPILDLARQQHGFAHAGLTFALGDSAAGYAALSTLPDGHEVLTAEMKINLLAPGKGKALIAKGRVLKPGRRLVVVAAEIFAQGEDGSESCIAVMQGTMVPIAP